MDLLDIITALNRELRFNASFRALLHDCDEATRQRVTRHYIEFVFREIGAEPEHPHGNDGLRLR
jgi:hypothetical protein